MLIRFTVSNYLSFNEEIEFSMIPGKCRSHTHHVVKGNKRSNINILRAGVIYGANASGKSNLVKAISFARNLVINGTRPKKHIPRTHFKFDTSCVNKPSRFEFEFNLKKEAFAYGFELDTQRIHNEWLYKITKTTQKKIFERQTLENGESQVEFGNFHFKDKREQKLVNLMKTRENQLFLTQSIEAGIKQFEHISNWFRKLIIVFPEALDHRLEFTFEGNGMLHNLLIDFLKRFDIGISGISLKPIDLKSDSTALPLEIQTRLTEMLEPGKTTIFNTPDNTCYLVSMNERNELEAFKLMTNHKIKGSTDETTLEIKDESDGTQRLLELIPALYLVLNGDYVCIIDELDRSMHPKLSFNILEMFLDSRIKHESQLIVTTHETNLLNLNLLRRDEIWFVEKNKDGASSVFSLEEFIPRYDSDVRKGYLLGRFGGIPIVNNVVPKLGYITG
jgi:AAA15 family ATPase/GTPase